MQSIDHAIEVAVYCVFILLGIYGLITGAITSLNLTGNNALIASAVGPFLLLGVLVFVVKGFTGKR